MNVAIVKYNAGNIYSVVNALRRMGIEPTLTDDAELLTKADKVLFPQQLLCKHSEEGDVDCIGIFDAEVKRFQPERHEDKVPCMGWNRIEVRSEECGVSPLMEGLGENPYVYFVHSYYVPVCAETIAVADYILPYSASMHKDNFYACQFHPEKSGAVGERILKNFLEL